MIDTAFYKKCIQTLEEGYRQLQQTDSDSISYNLYRAAIVKEFEIILKQSGSLLKKCLKKWMHSSKAVDKLTYKDIFRQAGHHSLISVEEVHRWLQYRDNRNTAHDYGQQFADEVLKIIPPFIADAKKLESIFTSHTDD